MASEEAIRALLIEQLGVAEHLMDAVQLIDVALALGDTLGVSIPLYRLRHLHNYHDVFRAVRDALCDQWTRGEGECYVRARLRAGRITVVRVGALTPTFAAALAEDLRCAPAGSWLDVTVPDDLDDDAVAGLQRRLAWLLGPTAALIVRRAGVLGPDAARPWDRMTQASASASRLGALGGRLGPGIAIAPRPQDQPQERRRLRA